MIRQMRRVLVFALMAGCSSTSSEAPERPAYNALPREAAPTPSAGSPSAAQDARDLDRWNGQEVELQGIFESDRAIHGVLRLSSGLRVWLVHFDHIRRGDDWLSYVGKPCSAYGVLHTYTRDIDGYRHPRLEVKEFSGTRE